MCAFNVCCIFASMTAYNLPVDVVILRVNQFQRLTEENWFAAGCQRMSARVSALSIAVTEDDERCRDACQTPLEGDAGILETI